MGFEIELKHLPEKSEEIKNTILEAIKDFSEYEFIDTTSSGIGLSKNIDEKWGHEISIQFEDGKIYFLFQLGFDNKLIDKITGLLSAQKIYFEINEL